MQHIVPNLFPKDLTSFSTECVTSLNLQIFNGDCGKRQVENICVMRIQPRL